MSEFIERFKHAFEDYSIASISTIGVFYSEDADFIDPLHQLKGRVLIEQYFGASLKNVHFCRFEFIDQSLFMDAENIHHRATLEWRMHYSHPQLASGKDLVLNGVSVVHFGEHIYYHRDYYDLGEMLYENVWGLGRVVRALKSRLVRSFSHNKERGHDDA